MTNLLLPRANAAIVSSSGIASIEFRNFLQSLIDSGQFTDQQAEIEAILVRLEALENADEIDAQVYGILSVLSIGSLQDGAVALQLVGDTQEPGNTYYYGTGPDGTKGWHTVESALAVEPRLTKAVGADGVSTFDLAELANSGAGTSPVKIYTRDAYGRIEGDQDADTDNLPEGTENLYFTDERAQDAVGNILQGVGGDVELHYADGTPLIFANLSSAISAVIASALQPGDNVSELTNDAGYITEAPIDGTPYARQDAAWVPAPGGAAAVWGGITGTLSDQTDLQTALDARQPLDGDLTAIAGANPVGNQGVYWVAANTVATYLLTDSGRALAGISGAANAVPYFTSSSAVSTFLSSAAGRELANVTAAINTAPWQSGAGVWSNQAVTASGRGLWGIAGTSGNIAYLSALNTWSLTTITSFARTSLLNQPSATTTRAALVVDFSGALVASTAAQSIPNNTSTALTFDTETYDAGGYHDNVTNPSRITVLSNGAYLATANVTFNTNTVGIRQVEIRKNGAAFAGMANLRATPISGFPSILNVSTGAISLVAGDYLEVWVFQDSGAALNVLSGTTTSFGVYRVSADAP